MLTLLIWLRPSERMRSFFMPVNGIMRSIWFVERDSHLLQYHTRSWVREGHAPTVRICL